MDVSLKSETLENYQVGWVHVLGNWKVLAKKNTPIFLIINWQAGHAFLGDLELNFSYIP